MRIPRKKELLELQRKYRTDKKIGEVYGVPARLVAYWRSKKKISSYSFPKYSEEKIREIWERFGDDGRAGEELSISRAGFRQWRRKYHIDHKPLQLRLEQLELPLPDMLRRKGSRRETIAQKILLKKSGLKKVDIGETVNIEPDMVMTHANSAYVIQHFNQLIAPKVWDPTKMVIVLEKTGSSRSGNGTPPRKVIRDFAKRQKIGAFYDIGQGVCHQLVLENAHILPGQFALGTDSQVTGYGSLGAFALAITPEDMASVWATGRYRLNIPETAKVIINGRLPRGVYSRDIALKLGKDFRRNRTVRKVLEFYGSTLSTMSISERFTLTCLADTMESISALVPFDDIAARYLRKIVKSRFVPLMADPDAAYVQEYEIDISHLTPQIESNIGKDSIQTVEEVIGKKIDQVVLGCCVNGRIDDLEMAARILRGRQINRDVRMLVIPASRKVLAEAVERGIIRSFIESGCMVMNPGCGSCIDAHSDYLESGEKGVTTAACTGLNRPENKDQEIFSVSPATAAATALEGAIADPRKYIK